MVNRIIPEDLHLLLAVLKRPHEKEPDAATDRHRLFLRFVADAANAGGFMAVQQYTSRDLTLVVADIEIGKLFYRDCGEPGGDRALSEPTVKLRLLTSLIGPIFAGGVCAQFSSAHRIWPRQVS